MFDDLQPDPLPEPLEIRKVGFFVKVDIDSQPEPMCGRLNPTDRPIPFLGPAPGGH